MWPAYRYRIVRRPVLGNHDDRCPWATPRIANHGDRWRAHDRGLHDDRRAHASANVDLESGLRRYSTRAEQGGGQ